MRFAVIRLGSIRIGGIRFLASRKLTHARLLQADLLDGLHPARLRFGDGDARAHAELLKRRLVGGWPSCSKHNVPRR